ncbi:MAG: Gfo/Idh/MocA family oxidoreductase, partial [Kiritimatiellaeota bacterium]|nr:Gfo/Idh/MocA family oxidoreductase [Kiritimatiellota bacterium]
MQTNRRNFLKVSAAAASALAFPMIIPARGLGADAPSKRLRVAQIGCGRIGFGMDMPGVVGTKLADYVAVCDYDARRAAYAKEYLEGAYKKAKLTVPDIAICGDYKEILARADVDAVVISTPDHQHAEPAAAAALAGKDIWLQKPLAMAVAESRACCDTVTKANRILQIGSQQRSSTQFRQACEYVRSGRIDRITHVEIGLPKDETKADEPEQPVPPHLNFDAWLGSTPKTYYTEQAVHSQKMNKGKPDVSSRPGWLRNEDHTLGMITGWGSHHFDILHWGLGIVEGGPEKVEGEAEFPTNKIWNVHLGYKIQYTYPGNIIVNVSDKYPNGVKFIGEEGWIFVSRGSVKTTASDPTTGGKPLKALDASKPALITGDPKVKLYVSKNHHMNWVE